jgi:predicted aspartyl protease
MREFTVPLAVSDSSGRRYEEVDALVDTGATDTRVPESLLRSLGHESAERRDFVHADGTRVQYGVKWVTVRLQGSTHPTPVVFGRDDAEPLRGVVTLEASRLGVDSVNQRLIPTPASLKGYRG